MGDGIRHINLTDAEQGSVLLTVILPKNNDPLGVFAPVRETAWAGLIRTVSGEALSHATHGWATPLIRELGPPPSAVLRRHLTPCSLSTGNQCVGATANCRPGARMPDCYEPPKLPLSVSSLVSTVLLELRGGRYVIAVSGSEFVLT